MTSFLDFNSPSIYHLPSMGACGIFWVIHLRDREMDLPFGQTLSLSLKTLLGLLQVVKERPAQGFLPGYQAGQVHLCFQHPHNLTKILSPLVFEIKHWKRDTRIHVSYLLLPLLITPCNSLPSLSHPSCPNPLISQKGLLFHALILFPLCHMILLHNLNITSEP